MDFDEQNNIISEYFLKNIVDMNNKEILDTVFKDNMVGKFTFSCKK